MFGRSGPEWILVQRLTANDEEWADDTVGDVESLAAFIAVAARSRAALLLPSLTATALWHGKLPPAMATDPERTLDEARGISSTCRPGGCSCSRPSSRYSWAELLRRVLAIDVLRCPACGARRRLIALIGHGPVVRRMLEHLGLPAEPPALMPARSPPQEATS